MTKGKVIKKKECSVNVTAVIVSYNSDLPQLRSILTALISQCEIVVVDNSDDVAKSVNIQASTEAAGGIFLSMNGNRGIGAAQNAGIAEAFRRGAESVLLLDDDSMPASDLVITLVDCQSRDQTAVFGAVALDIRGNDISNAYRRSDNMPKCREMMSSGTLIPRDIFQQVGSFDEGLFIDCVDFDWGWRAQRLGVSLYICRDAKIIHRLGDGVVGGMRFPAPFRHYYQYRNILRMVVRPYVPLSWRIEQMLKLPAKLILLAFLLPDRNQRLKYAFAGIRDAFRGRLGRGKGRIFAQVNRAEFRDTL